MNKRLLTLFFIFSVFGLSAQNLMGVRVDNLTDAQITQIYQRGQAQGVGISEGAEMAINMGLSPEEAAKFQARLQALLGESEDQTKVVQDPVTTIDPVHLRETERLVTKGSKRLTNSVTVYGQEVFRQGDLQVYERSLDAKAPSTYILGEGDQIGVSVYGTSYFQRVYTVDARGNIAMENWGNVQVRGLTFEQAQRLIKAKIRPYFNLSSNELTVTLSYSRTIAVNIVGEVLQPGTYKMPAINTVFNALIAAGGPNDLGTLRDIQVLRDGQVVQHLDVYQFLNNPQFQGDFYLQDNDYLFVGPAKNVVTVVGEIHRPMRYELLADEFLEDLMGYAGDITPKAYPMRVQIRRLENNQLRLMDVARDLYPSTPLAGGDSVLVPALNAEMRQYVGIEGAVMQPGTFAFEAGMTVSELVQIAGGTMPDIVRSEAYISRMKPDQTLAFISFNLEDALENGGPTLENKDQVHIIGVPDFDKNMAVSVQGAVRAPKTIAFADGMTLGDVLRMAGGLNPNADFTRVEVNRLNAFSNYNGGTNREVRTVATITAVPQALSKTLEVQDPSLEYALQPYDQVVVREIPDFDLQNLVYVGGEVQYPGFYALLSKDERLASLIARTGGITPFASAKNAELIRQGRPNISMNLDRALASKTSAFNLILQEGDSLMVPRMESLITISGPGTKYFVRNGAYELNAPFTPGRRAGYYVKNYGLGYAKKASRVNTYVTYENGQFKKSQNYGLFHVQPLVREGATIHTVLVEPKPKKDKTERKSFDWNQAVATVTSAVMGFSTVYVLLTR